MLSPAMYLQLKHAANARLKMKPASSRTSHQRRGLTGKSTDGVHSHSRQNGTVCLSPDKPANSKARVTACNAAAMEKAADEDRPSAEKVCAWLNDFQRWVCVSLRKRVEQQVHW